MWGVLLARLLFLLLLPHDTVALSPTRGSPAFGTVLCHLDLLTPPPLGPDLGQPLLVLRWWQVQRMTDFYRSYTLVAQRQLGAVMAPLGSSQASVGRVAVHSPPRCWAAS